MSSFSFLVLVVVIVLDLDTNRRERIDYDYDDDDEEEAAEEIEKEDEDEEFFALSLPRANFLRAADADQVFARMDVHPAAGDRRCAVSQFSQRILRQQLKMVGSFHHHDLASARNAEQPTVHANWRAEKISADPFLPFDLTRRRHDATDNPGIAPKEKMFIDTDAGGHIGGRTTNGAGQFRLPGAGSVARTNRHEDISPTAAAA